MKPPFPPALLQKYLSGQCTEEEKVQVEAWYDSMQGETAFLDQLPETDVAGIQENTFLGIKNQLGFEENKPEQTINWRWLTSIAASVLIAAGVYFLYHIKNQSKEQIIAQRHVRKEAVALVTFRNEAKRIVIHRLPDRSSVAMHPDAIITYPQKFDSAQRAVTFSGEGFFDIQKDPSRPFLIESGELVIRVLGTSFNVKAPVSRKVVQVDVVTGSVQVSARGKVGNPQQVTLKPKEQALFEAGSGKLTARAIAPQIRKPIYEPVTIVFEETPMNTVTEQLEKRFNVNISLSNPGLAHCSVTANFESQPLSSILEMLCTTLEASYSLSGETITISGAPCE
ncbi:FecR family protein [Dyadobacter aurulentus]|uniref:FecR family protein n=1 Tax=Dyadobacter sp. UC 10 TaxID=2605428 RepID=UPI0011F0F15A|nr:FecR domain-containing protein [Dyadobacter sp. UC 10]KAA0991999.1 DUF4974 domain-containing protein [Dyadobacter sp. UC 10]